MSSAIPQPVSESARLRLAESPPGPALSLIVVVVMEIAMRPPSGMASRALRVRLSSAISNSSVLTLTGFPVRSLDIDFDIAGDRLLQHLVGLRDDEQIDHLRRGFAVAQRTTTAASGRIPSAPRIHHVERPQSVGRVCRCFQPLSAFDHHQ